MKRELKDCYSLQELKEIVAELLPAGSGAAGEE